MNFGLVLSGLGNAVSGYADMKNDRLKREEDEKNYAERLKLQEEKERRVAEFTTKLKTDAEANSRRQQVTDINNAQEDIVASRMNEQFASSDAAVADAEAGRTDAPLTPEQQSVIAQVKAQEESKLRADPKLRTEAAYRSGYITPEKMADIESKDANNAARIEMVEKRIEASQALQTERLKYMHELQVLRLQNASAGGGDKTPAAVLTAKWLMDNKDNPVAMSAWRMANKTDDDEGEMAKQIFLKDKEGGMGKMTPEEAKLLAKQFTQSQNSFPSAKPQPGNPPKVDTAKNPMADQFIVGKKYKDAKGNVATYRGNGKWEQN